MVVDSRTFSISGEFRCIIESGPIKLFPKLQAQEPVSLQSPQNQSLSFSKFGGGALLQCRGITKQEPPTNNGSQEALT